MAAGAAGWGLLQGQGLEEVAWPCSEPLRLLLGRTRVK